MIKKIRIIIIATIAIVSIAAVVVFFNKYLYRSKAATENINIYFQPLSCLGVSCPNNSPRQNQEFWLPIQITAQSSNKTISAFTLNLEYDPDNKNNLEYIGSSINPPRLIYNNLEQTVTNEGGKKKVKISYIAKKNNDALPSALLLNLKFKTLNPGQTTITFTNDDSQLIIGPIAGYKFGINQVSRTSTINIGNDAFCTDNSQCGANSTCDTTNKKCVCSSGSYNCDGIWSNGCESTQQCVVTPPTQPGGNTLIQEILGDDGHNIYWRYCGLNAQGWPDAATCGNWNPQDWANKRGAGNEVYKSLHGYILNTSTEPVLIQMLMGSDHYSVYWRYCGLNAQGWPDESKCGTWNTEDWSNIRAGGGTNINGTERYLSLSGYILNTSTEPVLIQTLLDENGYSVYWRYCGLNAQGWPDESKCGTWNTEDWSNIRAEIGGGININGTQRYLSLSGYILNTRTINNDNPVLIQMLLDQNGATVYWRYCSLNSDGWPDAPTCGKWNLEDWSNLRGNGGEKYKSLDGYMINTTNISPPGNTTLNIKLKFQGIVGQPVGGNQMDVKVKVAGGNLSQPTDYQTVTFTVNDKGIWSGVAGFDLAEASNYRIYIKGPKHIQKRICENTPSEEESMAGTYHCFDGKIHLAPGSNDLDFSKILQLVGDLPDQDGVVNAYDISLIRNNLTSRDPEILKLADLNLDGVVDTQDHSLVISSLSVKYDDE